MNILNKIFVSLFAIFLLADSFYGQITAYVDHKTFNTVSNPYVEVYMEVLANSIHYKKNENGVGKCQIEILQLLKSNDSILAYDKFILINPEEDSSQIFDNLLDVKRYDLVNNQTYTIEITFNDLLDTQTEAQSISLEVKPRFSKFQCEFSDIQLVSSFSKTNQENVLSKSGYDLVPLVSDFLNQDFLKIAYYFEVYHSIDQFGADGRFILTHFIENTKTKSVAGNFSKTKKQTAQEIIPVLNAFDIRSLPTGSYHLVAQVKDRENKVIAEKRIPFSRYNSRSNTDPKYLKDVNFKNTFVEDMLSEDLDDNINCLLPIVDSYDSRLIEHKVPKFSDSLKRQFIYSFWYNKDTQYPENAWMEYKKQVDLVDKLFRTTVKDGYETDRGRTYLKYGKPNTIHDLTHEGNYRPHKIWHYYKVGQYNNIRFVFANPKGAIPNEFQLLHSDLRGEFYNPNWKTQVALGQNQGLDSQGAGNKSNTYYDNP